MAYDLFYGQTSRDWSCGFFPAAVTHKSQVFTKPLDAEALGETTRREIARNATATIKLSRAGRLPEAETAAFRKFHLKWTMYTGEKQRVSGARWRAADAVALDNFRRSNSVFTARLATFATVARAPLRTPPVMPSAGEIAAPSAGQPFRPPGSESPTSAGSWPLLLGAGLALAGVATLVTRPSLAR